jgi:hypothetical protein
MAATYNITIKKGATFRRKFTVKDSDNVAVNLTGCTPIGSLLPKSASEIPLTVANGKLTITNAVAGEVTLVLSATETAAYIWKAGRWYFNVLFPSGDVEDYLEGSITLSPLGG